MKNLPLNFELLDDQDILQELEIEVHDKNKVQLDIYLSETIDPDSILIEHDENFVINFSKSAEMLLRYPDQPKISIYMGPMIMANNEFKLKKAIELLENELNIITSGKFSKSLSNTFIYFFSYLYRDSVLEIKTQLEKIIFKSMLKSGINTPWNLLLDIDLLSSPRVPIMYSDDNVLITDYDSNMQDTLSKIKHNHELDKSDLANLCDLERAECINFKGKNCSKLIKTNRDVIDKNFLEAKTTKTSYVDYINELTLKWPDENYTKIFQRSDYTIYSIQNMKPDVLQNIEFYGKNVSLFR